MDRAVPVRPVRRGIVGTMSARRRMVPWPAVAPVLGIATVTVVMGAEAGILVYLLPAEALLIGGLLVYARRRWRRADESARSTGVFQVDAMGRSPDTTVSPVPTPIVGLVNGPVGKLTADAAGIRWFPNSPRRSRVPEFDAEWSEVEGIEIVPVRGLGDPAFVHVSLRSGVRRTVLAGSASALRTTIEGYAPNLLTEFG
jgi:hypothetical protein